MNRREFQIVVFNPNHSPQSFVFSKDQVVIGNNEDECDIPLNNFNQAGERLIVKRTDSNIFTITNDSKITTMRVDGRPNPIHKTAIWHDKKPITIGSTTLRLNSSSYATSNWDRLIGVSKWGIGLTLVLCLALLLIKSVIGHNPLNIFVNLFTIGFSTLFLGHGLLTLTWMVYGWNNLSEVDSHRSPTEFEAPQFSFTALLPARHEEMVIKDTVKAINRIDYPEELKQILVLCRQDDVKTIAKVQEVIDELAQPNIELVVFNSYPINKPHSLNNGLRRASHEVVTVFDAEDEPHPDLYHIINTIMLREKADVVQSGVQLMNYLSNWFSALNVLEYFFWFSSGLHFFTKVGQVTPLGGNSVFFKKEYLEKIGGWDELCLTEDADVGIKLTLMGAKIRIVYDERHATQEETPDTTQSFIKQRARWSQGFLQIFAKGDWARLPKLRQRLVAAYILLTPIIQSLLVITLPIGLWIAVNAKLPLIPTLISYTPLYMLVLQFTTHLYGMYEFTRAYKLKFPIWLPLALLVTYYPYQVLLAFAALRGLYRVTLKQNNWEKTAHTNAHRQIQTETEVVEHGV